MSRLDEHRRKQFMKKMIFFGAFLIILIVLIATLGFSALINSSLFVSNLISPNGNDQSQNTNDNFFGTLSIDAIPNATNSAQITVSGSASNFDIVEYYINDEKVKTIEVNSYPSFSDEIGDLKKGVNNVYIKAISRSAKKEKNSETYNVVYSDDKPKLEISDPKDDNTKTSQSEVVVGGDTDKDITVRVNQFPVIVDAKGHFQYTVRLKEGENKIDITAEDQAGNIEKKTVTITYRKDD